MTQAIIYLKGWMGNWKSTGTRTKLDLNSFKWSEGMVGGRREEEETEICSNTPPPFPSYFTRNSWNNTNQKWLAAEFPLTLFKVFIVFLNKPPPHAPAYCCCGIFVLCVILLRWEYVAPSSWYIDSRHNIITPSIHSQLAFCQLILTDCRASSFLILT